MAKIKKEDVVPGLLCASARYSDLMVVGWFSKSRGLVNCLASLPGENRPVTLPYQSLRW
jgi:hypothetical protein